MTRIRRLLAAAAVLAAAIAGGGTAQAAGRCGSHPWCETSLTPDTRADLLLGALTRDEKISLLAGDDPFGVTGGAQTHTGRSDGVARVELPTTYYSDGPVGVRSGMGTRMPAPIALASTFDRTLAFQHGSVIGNEAKSKGNDVVFAPTVNLLRTPLWGRAFEAYSEDPYLTARIGVDWIKGLQSQGVIANVKHFAANNQEGAPPGTLVGGSQGSRQTVNVVVDERTLREMYLSHFEAAIKEANAGSVMCSYNRLNGQYACENRHLLTEILKGEWGFKGFVLADYGAAHPGGTGASLTNGLDFEPWPGWAYNPVEVNGAIAAGQADDAAIDEHVHRVLRTLFAYGFFDRDAYPYDDDLIDKQGHADSAQRIEEAGIVLLKNDGVLPLDPAKVKTLAVIGEAADGLPGGGGSSEVTPFFFNKPKDEIEARGTAAGMQVRYDTGQDADQAAALAASSDAAVVFVADAASEGTDKPCMGLNCGSSDNFDRDALIDRVRAANPRTIVVLETAAPVLTPWRGGIAGLVEAWYPGVGGGKAIAGVLFGDVNPSGRLPATFPKREADEPYAGDPEAYPGVLEEVEYKEGVFVGYRWFDEHGIEPAYPFGHGLSYTSFRYRNLRVKDRADGGASVSVDVTNTGPRAGTEVAQLYLGMPDPAPTVRQPPRVLRGFQRVTLARRQTKTARFQLTPRDLSYWRLAVEDWRIAPGCYRVMVGASSRDIRLEDVLGRGGAACARAAGSCLARRAPLGPRGIGRVRIGLIRRALRRLPGLTRRRARVYRYCVKGGRGRVVAVVSPKGRALLVVTTAPGHRSRRIRPGRRANFAARRLSPGLTGVYRLGPRRIAGVRRGRIRFIGVAATGLRRHPAKLRKYLRRAGV